MLRILSAIPVIPAPRRLRQGDCISLKPLLGIYSELQTILKNKIILSPASTSPKRMPLSREEFIIMWQPTNLQLNLMKFQGHKDTLVPERFGDYWTKMLGDGISLSCFNPTGVIQLPVHGYTYPHTASHSDCSSFRSLSFRSTSTNLN